MHKLTFFHRYPRRKNQHEEIEILLENYLRQIEQIEGNIKELRETITVTEEYVNLQLDSVRNRMMRHTLVLSVGTMSTSIGGLITGAFGMNLATGLEAHPHAFATMSALVALSAFGVFLALRRMFGIRYLAPLPALPRKVRVGAVFHQGFMEDLHQMQMLHLQQIQQHMLSQCDPQEQQAQAQSQAQTHAQAHAQEMVQAQVKVNGQTQAHEVPQPPPVPPVPHVPPTPERAFEFQPAQKQLPLEMMEQLHRMQMGQYRPAQQKAKHQTKQERSRREHEEQALAQAREYEARRNQQTSSENSDAEDMIQQLELLREWKQKEMNQGQLAMGKR